MYQVIANNQVRKMPDFMFALENDKPDEANYHGGGFSEEYQKRLREYEKIKEKKLPTYPISGNHNWKEGQLIPDDEIRIEKHTQPIEGWQPSYNNPDDPPTETFYLAIPKQTEPSTGSEEDGLKELPEPVGKFILSQKDLAHQTIITPNGNYYHYSAVCVLMRKFADQEINKLNLTTNKT